MEKKLDVNNNINKKRIDVNDNILYMLPKYEKYMEYMLDNVVSKLPRIEKFNLGNEIKISMFESMKYILILSKVDKKNRLVYLNMLDASICVQRIYIRIMYKRRYLDKLKAYFEIEVSECGNIFSVNISERYLGVVLVGELYSNLCVGVIVCIYGSAVNNNYIICNEIYIL